MTADRIARTLLRLYPPSFRERHGAPVLEAFRRQRDEGRVLAGLGDVAWGLAAEWFRAARRLERPLLDGLVRDLGLAGRRMARRPGFTATVVLTLAVGVGATTAVFSALHAVALRPLPFPEPERLVRIFGTDAEGDERSPIGLADALDWRREATSLAAVAMYDLEGVHWITPDGREPVGSAAVSANFFRLLGVEAARGRLFAEGEDRGPSRVAVLTREFWTARLGADPDVVGSELTLGDGPYTVLGVLPASFEDPLTEPDYPVRLYTLFDLDPSSLVRGQHSFRALARLAPGVSRAAAQEEMDAVSARIRELHPDVKAGRGVRLVPLHQALVGEAAPALGLLLGAGVVLLLVACVNVANLLLARTAAHERERAVRTALGAGRARLAGQLLVESAALALLGGVVGLVGAGAVVGAVLPALAERIPRVADAGLHPPVLAFTLAVSLGTALLVAILPLVRTTAREPTAGLRGRGAGPGAGSDRRLGRLLGGLAAAEIALCALLLVTAGLLVRGFDRLLAVDTGFVREDVLTFRLAHPWGSERRDRLYDLHDELEQRLGALPGVRAVGAVNFMPLMGNWACIPYTVEEAPRPPDADPCAEFRTTTPGYFEALGLGLVEGRSLRAGDDGSAERVMVVNRTMAERGWPDGSPVGRTMKWGRPDQGGDWWTVVGVVEDVRHFGLGSEARPEVYMTYRQGLDISTEYAVRAVPGTDPADLLPAVRALVTGVDGELALSAVATMEERVRADVAEPRVRTLLVGLFSAAALMLAVVGVYGVLSVGAARRRPEIGLRLALGAGHRRVVATVVGRALVLAVPAVLVGLAAALPVARALQAFLFGVSPFDPWVYAVVGVGLPATAALAAWIPARRAAAVSPVEALRAE